MEAEEKKIEAPSSEAQDVIRNLVSAIRAVKLYPPNNPIYSQTIRKSCEALIHFLETEKPECHVGVQRTYFTHEQAPVGKDAQLNSAIAQDLFSRGIREVVFSIGVTEGELMNFYQALALPPEELAMRSGISSVLWEVGATHIKVTEAGLDEVITADAAKTDGGESSKPFIGDLDEATAKKEMTVGGRSVVLGDLMTDPGGFGAGLIELAKQTAGAMENVDDRLFALYTEAGRKIWTDYADQSDALFEGLAQSALSLDQSHRERLIAGRLYAELDAELESERKAAPLEMVPNDLHEIVTGRFSTAWTGEQVSTLLKKSSAKKKTTRPSAPSSPGALEAVPLSKDLGEIARDLAEYTPEEMEVLKAMSEAGMESDIIEAAVRTLIFLLPLVKKTEHPAPDLKELKLFSGVVRQLEEMQSYLLKKKDYDLAALIARVFRMPVDPAFSPRMAEAAKKAASSAVLAATIDDLKRCPPGSPEYQSAYAYLATAERETTKVLLELLAEETGRLMREFYMALLKDVGKNHLMLIGEHLSDERWFFVRNIVSILGESKTDHALAFLHKVANHKDARIREEVIKGLISIGGKKAASLVAKFLDDKIPELQLKAIQGLAGIEGIGVQEAKPLIEFLESRPLKRRSMELTIEAIRALGRIGGRDAEAFLTRYDRIRWWKPKKLQAELRAAAQLAIEEIKRRW